ncbi:hypothetical protein TeGR_g13273, partial [Tetraparma gracilis]
PYLPPPTPSTPGAIKRAIPAECFEHSILHSIYFVFRDTAWAVLVVFLAATFLDTAPPPALLSLAMLKWVVGWNLYAFWMGTVLTGHWVLAHECGHGAFSSSPLANDIFGYLMHQALLVPYFAWQHSHAKHHRRTNHLTDGDSHVPTTAADYGLSATAERLGNYAWIHELLGDGCFAGFQVVTHLVVGWPLYLLGLASTGKLAFDGTRLQSIPDHYRPWSQLFPAKLRLKIFLSTFGVAATLGLLLKLSLAHGFLPVALWYWGPYMWTNAWLVLYTWLQHTDPSVPQYGADEWTWVKGAISTIDRPYYIFDYFHHKIGSTHVAHHLFHEMPFFKADLATKAIKEFLGPLYNYDPTPFPIATWKIAMTCHYVEGEEGIQYFKSFNDVPLTSERLAAEGAKKAN